MWNAMQEKKILSNFVSTMDAVIYIPLSEREKKIHSSFDRKICRNMLLNTMGFNLCARIIYNLFSCLPNVSCATATKIDCIFQILSIYKQLSIMKKRSPWWEAFNIFIIFFCPLSFFFSPSLSLLMEMFSYFNHNCCCCFSS